MARRDLDNADVRALTMQFQACGDAVFAQLSAHPSRFQAGGVQGLLYGVGALAAPVERLFVCPRQRRVLVRVSASFFTGS